MNWKMERLEKHVCFFFSSGQIWISLVIGTFKFPAPGISQRGPVINALLPYCYYSTLSLLSDACQLHTMMKTRTCLIFSLGFVFYDQHIPSLFPKLCTLLIYSHPLLPPFGLVEEQQEAKKLSNIKKLN